MAKKNIKQLALDHVEKVVFGLLALVGLLALAGTNWSPYRGTPEEITDKVTKGRQTWTTTDWPEEQQKEFVITRENAPMNLLYERIYKGLSPTVIEMSWKPSVRIKEGIEPVRDPDLVAVQNMIATSGRVFLEMQSELPEETNPLTPGGTPGAPGMLNQQDENVPDEFRQSRNTASRNTETMSLDYASALETRPGRGDSMMMSTDEMGMSGSQVNLNGQGFHFVSVRGIFPVRDQITKYAEAIHRTYHQAAMTFDILDFELERQTAIPGDDPWSGTWEKVDLQTAYDIVDRAANLQTEVVSSTVTNGVITMPLPIRVTGEWRKDVTHPQIEKFELTDSQMDLETDMQHKLLAEAAAQRKQMDASVRKRGGFATTAFDARQMESDMLGIGMYSSSGGSGMGMSLEMSGPAGGQRNPRGGNQISPLDKLVADMARGATNKTEEEKRIRDWIQSRISAEGELLLFRYLDFNVEPGKFYRYRVRLVLTNPNFGRHLQEAGGVAHVVEGDTRTTPWSGVTEPAYIEEDYRYFVTDVVESNRRVLPSAKFDVYEWNPKFGTFINSPLEVRMGQPISDEVKTKVIDPAKGTNEEQSYKFVSSDYFVDASPEIRLEDALHEKADDGKVVKFPVGSRGKMPIPPKTLVSRSTDQLVSMSPSLNRKDHDAMKSYLKLQEGFFEYLKAPKESETSPLDELGLGSTSEGEVSGRKKDRKASALKRKTQSGDGMRGP